MRCWTESWGWRDTETHFKDNKAAFCHIVKCSRRFGSQQGYEPHWKTLKCAKQLMSFLFCVALTGNTNSSAVSSEMYSMFAAGERKPTDCSFFFYWRSGFNGSEETLSERCVAYWLCEKIYCNINYHHVNRTMMKWQRWSFDQMFKTTNVLFLLWSCQ